MKTFFVILVMLSVVIFVLVGLFNLFKKDEWIGFYYPDKDNLSYSIQSNEIFDDFNQCIRWVNSQVYKYNPDDRNFDYECGLNCKNKNGMNVCEETIN